MGVPPAGSKASVAYKPAPGSSHTGTNQSSSGSSDSSSRRSTLPPSSVHSGAQSISSRRSKIGGYDGSADPPPAVERDPAKSRVIVEPKNFDLGMSGWATVRGTELTNKPQRQPLSKLGQPTKVGLNTYHVESFPNIAVYQYDVMIGNGIEKRGLIDKVWNSKAVKAEMGNFTVFDGNKLAWSGKPINREIRLDVDLDAEQGRVPKVKNEKNIVRVMIRQTNKVGFQTLMAHLAGKATFDNTCLEVINFADHLLRMTPSRKYTSIKRAFFKRGEDRFPLGGGVEAFKGVYQSLRLVHPGRLSINIDVANGTFWQAIVFPQAANLVCGTKTVEELASILSSPSPRGGEKSVKGQALKRMRKLRVFAKHRGKQELDEYTIERFIFKSAKEHKVQVMDPSGKEVEMSLYQYFMTRYNITINHPGLPLVKMTKGKNTVLPMEVLKIKENQRYNFKMDERQTSNMIKFAVTAPPERYRHIEQGIKMLDWANDPILQKYGVKVNPNKTMADGRVLVAPTVKFGVGDAKPGTSGRWDLKGKKFLMANPMALKSWAVCVIPGRRGGKPDKSQVENFVKAFVQGYIQHGGKVENKQPSMVLGAGEDVGAWVTQTWNAAGNQSQSRPQILLFILPDKDSQVYGRIKRSCECRYGVVSQCVQYAHAQKAAPQYISNVLMKFNCKLGGATCRAVGPKTGGATGIFTVPTVIVGADVSHSAPGVQAPSMAAMTISTDKLATRYAALVQTNGYRVEMINSDIIKNELKPMLQHWISNVGAGKVPQHFIYLRDGVSEGQYNHVLQQEVNDMKQLLKVADPANSTKFIVVVGSKRHHVRFFPEKGDRNGNAFPGTLVETSVTNPTDNDFYLCSHAAIKGTARPAHYYVLLNEPNMSNDMLHTLLYEHAYQYQRASTPISQHPAIYYAHLASNRAVPHDPKWAGSSDGPTSSDKKQSGSQSGSQAGGSGTRGSSSGIITEFDKLMPMPNQGAINTSMWYI
ncbi:Putative PAZ domain, Piwi domain, ribonuclease H-like superfamily, argonaute, linker 1 [Septoria linicola]|uniref:PAZ domain, Piwi domain, ribonuclease H-like superfamily, argonaute, linker 1 n=1 Tax=Septoria linicola TaxID=215465 RepID=A0A9Q9EQJ9_9PEZI|nr:putative PAZ domain, Piwi domain, ribonuclease H-like superfamily, argonaute, linker 1 [Septoria linicola]USW59205.1 Putative PAZ domain, Piwi domain, ribonuclease H-like superfamily, argonaute, linker 1 [Septoria linicola]